MSEKKLLTKEIAEQLIDNEDSVDLREFTGIEDAGAESLAGYDGSLDLPSLTSISDAAAESLSKHEFGLCLGVEELSGAAALSLSHYEKDMLHLPFLKCLGGEAGHLALAENLLKENWDDGVLYLNSLTEVSLPAIQVLGRNKGKELSLGLTHLSDDMARALVQYEGWLNLEGLSEISDTAADILSMRKGKLSMMNLEELSDIAAQNLAKIDQEVSPLWIDQELREKVARYR